MNFIFNHAGHFGDLVFSLYFCTELAEKYGVNKFDFNIQVNVPNTNAHLMNHPNGGILIPPKAAEALKPLLEAQPYINKVTTFEQVPAKGNNTCVVDLNMFRKLPVNFAAGDIRRWYYNLTNVHLPGNFFLPVLTATPDFKYKDKIVLLFTERYKNEYINYKCLEPFKEHLIFLGLPHEHTLFEQTYFPVAYCETSNLLQCAEIMMGARGVVGGQSGLFSIAECLKVPRILVSPEFIKINGRRFPGPVNNHPMGGWNEVVVTEEKLIHMVQELINASN